MILSAAVEIDGVIRALPAPARHHEVMRQYPLHTQPGLRGLEG